MRDLAADPPRAALMTFGLLSLAAVVARGLIDGYLFDRYLWTLVPVVVIWLLRGDGPTRRATVRLTAAAVALL
nr:hypothetical protein [Actinomycetota bacterium]